MKKVHIIFDFRWSSTVDVMQVNNITVHLIGFVPWKRKKRKKKKQRYWLKWQTQKTAKNKQTKISHYLEVGQNSGFYWVLKKLSLHIKGNANLERNLILSISCFR